MKSIFIPGTGMQEGSLKNDRKSLLKKTSDPIQNAGGGGGGGEEQA